MYYVYCHIIIIKAYCVGGSKCCALLLYAVKLTKVSAILISPSIAWPLLRCELFAIEAISKAMSMYVRTD